MTEAMTFPCRAVLSLMLVTLALTAAPASIAQAQSEPFRRYLHTYIPPDQLVYFLPSTPLEGFLDAVNPLFTRVTGKPVIYPDADQTAIGMPISAMHFVDALELVLQERGLVYRETERYFVVEPAPTAPAAEAAHTIAAPAAAPMDARQVQINVVLFEVNLTRARELGVDWGVLFGGGHAAETGRTGSGINVRTGRLLGGLGDLLSVPDVVDMSTLSQALRAMESEGIGETVARPQVTVQSGQDGRIQIGSDVPVQTRDFAGNTITQFFSTGVIIDVTPTLTHQSAADTAGAPVLDLIHMVVHIEKSGSRPTQAGPVIDRNTADTQVSILDGDQTVIGGLFSNETSTTRRGIPVLKDLPGWFFGLRYLFGHEQHVVAQKELLIVLQAHVIDPLARHDGVAR